MQVYEARAYDVSRGVYEPSGLERGYVAPVYGDCLVPHADGGAEAGTGGAVYDEAVCYEKVEHICFPMSGLWFVGFSGQGYRILLIEDLEEIFAIPSSPLALGGEYLGAVAPPHPAFILSEAHVQHPMHRVLDSPAASNSLKKPGSIARQTRYEVSRLP